MSIFSKVELNKIGSNIFDLSHDRKYSMDMGKLVPTLCMEVLPGDRISCQNQTMIRFAPLISPAMHQVSSYTHYYFIPNRILWPNWEKYITGGEDGQDASVHPYIELKDSGSPYHRVLKGSLLDYLGLPSSETMTGADPVRVNALPMAAYQMVYNEYYRDQNLIDPVDFELTDGNNSSNNDLVQLRVRAWQHDYFTSALPWPQKGPEVTIPLGTEAPIEGDFANIEYTATQGHTSDGVSYVKNPDGTLNTTATETSSNSVGNFQVNSNNKALDVSEHHGMTPENTNWYADLAAAVSSSIIDLRRAFRLQEWYELAARAGTRYTEVLKVFFGVSAQDSRLNRPEFLGGTSAPVVISEVLQNSATVTEVGSESPQGNMAGHGISVGGGTGFNYSVKEHGFIIGIQSVMPKTAYQQGIPKQFLKFDRFDYYWNQFAHIGEQAIYRKELYVQADAEEDEEVFGYTPRYIEYKNMPSTVHGDFRDTLDFWHIGRIFDNPPSLTAGFINCFPSNRIFAVEDPEQHKLWCHTFHKIKARRRMPYFGSPRM